MFHQEISLLCEACHLQLISPLWYLPCTALPLSKLASPFALPFCSSVVKKVVYLFGQKSRWLYTHLMADIALLLQPLSQYTDLLH